MILYKHARNLVQTEFMINEVIKMGTPIELYRHESVESLSQKENQQMKELIAHRMVLLNEMANMCGYRLEKIR